MKNRNLPEDVKVLQGCGEYRFTDGKSNKFWDVRPKNPGDPFGTYVVTWGKIGTRGQQQITDRNTAAKRISEKISKGYEMHNRYRAISDQPVRESVKEETSTSFLDEIMKIG